MNDTNLKSIIKPLINDGKRIRISQSVNDKIEIRWIQVLLVWEPNLYLGISEDGSLVVEENCGLRFLDSSTSLVRIKIILEKDLQNITGEIRETLQLDEKTDLFDVFPFVELVGLILSNDMPYWVNLALKWCESFPSNDLYKIKDDLMITANNKSMTQNIRHKAIKLLTLLEEKEINGDVKI